MYWRHAERFLLVSFLFYATSAAVVAVLIPLPGFPRELLAPITHGLLLIAMQTVLVQAAHDLHVGRVDRGLRETVSAALPSMPRVVAASIPATIAVATGLLAMVVPGLIVMTFWSLIVPAIVIGKSTAAASFGQSRRTVRGHGWNVFGTWVLVLSFLVVFAAVLSLFVAVLPVVDKNLTFTIVYGTLAAPLTAVVVTLVYCRLTTSIPRGSVGGPAW